MEKGILTVEQEKIIAGLLDDAVKVKGILELVDGYVFKAIVSFVDNTYAEKLEVDLKAQLSDLVEAILAEDVDEAEELAAEIINSLVDIPGLDETSEGFLFKGAVELIVGAVMSWVEKKKAETTTTTTTVG